MLIKTKTHEYISVAFIAIVVFISLCVAIPARAATISSQLQSNFMDTSGAYGGTNSSGSHQTCGVTDSVGVGNYLPLGTGLSGLPASLSLELSEDQGFAVDGTTRYFKVCLIESTSSGTTTTTGNYVLYDYRLSAHNTEQLKSASTTTYGGTFTQITTLDPTKYYGLVFISNSSQIGRLWGIGSGSFGFTCYSTGFTCNTGFKSPFYILSTDSGLSSIPSTTTQILTTVPTQNSITATSTTFTLSATGYISPTDYTGYNYIEFVGKQLAGQNDFGNSGPFGNNGGFTNTFDIQIPVTTQGNFNLSTTTSLINAGNWEMNVTIKTPSILFGFQIPYSSNTLSSKAVLFVAGTSTPAGDAQAAMLFGANPGTFGSTIVTSADAACNLLNLGAFSPLGCLKYIFIPTGNDLLDLGTKAENGFLSAYPWGYVTRIFYIAQNQSASSLLVATVTTPTTVMGNAFPVPNETLTIDPWSKFPGSGNSLLDTVTSPDGTTFRVATEPYWDEFVFFLFALSLIPTIMGISYRPSDGDVNTDWKDTESISTTENLETGKKSTIHTHSSRRRIS